MSKMLLTVLGQGALAGGNFVALVICSWILNAEQFGEFAIIYAVVNLTLAPANSFINEPQMIYARKAQFGVYPEVTLCFSVLIAFLLVPLVIAVFCQFSELEPAGGIFAAASTYGALLVLTQSFRSLALSLQYQKIASLADVAYAFALNISLLSLLFLLPGAFATAEILAVFTGALAAAFCIIFFGSRFVKVRSLTNEIVKGQLRKHLAYGWPLLPFALLSWGKFVGLVVIVGVFFGNEIAGGFRAASALLMPWIQLQIAFTNYYTPRISGNLKPDKGEVSFMSAARHASVYIGLAAGFSGFLFFWGAETFEVIFSRELSVYSNFTTYVALAPLTSTVYAIMLVAARLKERSRGMLLAELSIATTIVVGVIFAVIYQNVRVLLIFWALAPTAGAITLSLCLHSFNYRRSLLP